MKNLLFAACLLAITSCKDTGPTDTASTPVDSTAAPAPAPPQTVCYLLAEGRDSTSISLSMDADGSVTGTYDWQPWEADGAHGTVSGKREGDLVRLMYDYIIEGSNQQQEMVLKITGDQLEEGEGELSEGEGGVLKIKDETKLTWKPFAKVDCK